MQKVNVACRQLQTSFVDIGKRDSPITVSRLCQNDKRDSSQMPIDPCRLRVEWISERGDKGLMATSIGQISCDIREKDDKCLAVNADSKGMCKRAQTCTIKNQ